MRVALSKVEGLCMMVGGLDRMVAQAGKGKRRHFIYLKSLTLFQFHFSSLVRKNKTKLSTDCLSN